ncbi:AIPR family protein [Photobacterium leiognathi]|uniref:AIPR family protein n=1 Tax=Photobacterium leiognathi TaxID=553611 RepID=UPI002981ED5D|nr:AIPR family protein [Photobacterium leiognathi]
MSVQKIIIKVIDQSVQNGIVTKLIGNTPLSSLIPIITETTLDANPRKAKKNQVTEAILSTFEDSPELFHYMSKGILFAASDVRFLERNRVELQISDPSKEGILDGGHNTFSAGCRILKEAGYKDFNKIKGWEHLKQIWDEYIDKISEVKSSLTEIKFPIEIIYPSDTESGIDDFNDSVLAISAARNNNAQLKETAKANKAGLYDIIKESLDKNLIDEIEWQENDGGRIKTADIVALSLIPLSILPAEKYPVAKIIKDNPAMISSSKGTCVKYYNDLMNADGITRKVDDNVTVELVDPLVKSALSLMNDIPHLYDYIYKLMPQAYNEASPGFGRIKSVRTLDAEKWKEDKKSYLRTPAKTKFYRQDVKIQYPDGFMYPLIVSMAEHMEIKDNKVQWKSDPFTFIDTAMPFVFRMGFQSFIKGQNYDPGKVTKENSAYQMVSGMYEMHHKMQVLTA